MTDAHYYAENGNLNALKEHLSSNSNDIHAKDGEGDTPLHCAARKGRLDAVRYLIDKGSTIDMKNSKGNTPLHWAALFGHLDTVQFLIEQGSTIDMKNYGGWIPLHCAAVYDRLATAQFLIEKGSPIDTKSQEGKTPLDYAVLNCQYGMINFLREVMESNSIKASEEVSKSAGDGNIVCSNSTSNCISKEESKDIKFQCFLTHNWGNLQADNTYDNHERVRKIHYALEKMNVFCWFDSERMTGTINEKMSKGIDNSACVVVLITDQYIKKVNGDNSFDNCKLEFNYAAQCKGKRLMIPVVLDADCRDSSKWTGPFGFILRGELYVDFVNDADFDKNLSNLYDEINERIKIISQSTTVPLVDLSTNDVGMLANNLSMSNHVNDFVSNDITGEHLSLCETVNDLSDILGGMTISNIKGKVFLDKIKAYKISGVPKDMLK